MADPARPWDEPDRASYAHFNYFLTEAAQARYVLAAHYLRGCEHVVEIGGSRTPITKYLTHLPSSVLVVDPKMAEYHGTVLHGRACRIDHVRSTFQAYPFALTRGRYGLVILGLSLKHFADGPDDRSRDWDKLIGLVDGARISVIEFARDWNLGRREAETIVDRTATEILMRLDLDLGENEGEETPFPRRRFMVLAPRS